MMLRSQIYFLNILRNAKTCTMNSLVEFIKGKRRTILSIKVISQSESPPLLLLPSNLCVGFIWSRPKLHHDRLETEFLTTFSHHSPIYVKHLFLIPFFPFCLFSQSFKSHDSRNLLRVDPTHYSSGRSFSNCQSASFSGFTLLCLTNTALLQHPGLLNSFRKLLFLSRVQSKLTPSFLLFGRRYKCVPKCK